MDEAEIENALKERLGTAGIGLPIAWPSKDFEDEEEYLDVNFEGGEVEGPSLGANYMMDNAIMAVAVMVPLRQDYSSSRLPTTVANGYANQIRARFPQGLRLAITDGTITIMRPPTVVKGYRDGPFWRVNVVIRYNVTYNS